MQDIVVVGASAGGVEALQVLTAGLATDLPASVFVVLHIGRGIDGRSFLPEILAPAGALPVKHPVEGEEICRAQIYVAPPDRTCCSGSDTFTCSTARRRTAHGPRSIPYSVRPPQRTVPE